MILLLLIIQTITLKENPNLKFSTQEMYNSKNKYEFYQNIDVAQSPQNDLFILDIGNKRVIKLDSNYQEILRFGKDGSGPGEFDMVYYLSATKNRLIVSGLKKWLFDFDGNYKGEIQLLGVNCLFETADEIRLVKLDQDHLKIFRYSLDGEKLDNDSNYSINYHIQPNQKRISGLTYSKNRNAYYGFTNGDYEFFVKSDDHEQKYRRHYQRLKYENFDDLHFASQEVDMKQFRAEAIKQFLQINGEYRSDISSFIGEDKNYLFVQTSTNNQKELKFDLVDLTKNSFKEISQLSKDKVLRSRLFNDKLIICYMSEESGPYFTVYRYTLK